MKKTYRIDRRPGGLFFVCIDCGHQIDVNSQPKLQAMGLSKRTMAADVMRLHQEQAHSSISPKGSR